MKKTILMLVTAMVLFGANDVLAQARLKGKVVDKAGKAIVGAKITLHSERGGTMDPIMTKGNGGWGAILPIGGTWNIDVEAEGYQTSLGTLQVSEISRNPSVTTELAEKPKPVQRPEPVEQELVSTVPAEAVSAVRKAEELLRNVNGQRTVTSTDGTETIEQGEVPSGEEQQALYRAAIVELEKAQALLPEHLELKKALARAYYGAGEIEPAIGLLEAVLAAEPANAAIAMLQVSLLAEAGRLKDARELLDNMPSGALTDPTAVLNVGILFLNKGEAEEATSYFERAIAIDASSAAAYYYRGVAKLQMEDYNGAKQDFRKVVEMDAASPEAADAQAMLDQLG